MIFNYSGIKSNNSQYILVYVLFHNEEKVNKAITVLPRQFSAMMINGFGQNTIKAPIFAPHICVVQTKTNWVQINSKKLESDLFSFSS